MEKARAVAEWRERILGLIAGSFDVVVRARIFFIVLRARECGYAVLWLYLWFCGVVLVVLSSTATEMARNSWFARAKPQKMNQFYQILNRTY